MDIPVRIPKLTPRSKILNTEKEYQHARAVQALRDMLWVGVYLAQDAGCDAISARLTPLITDLDREIADLELQSHGGRQ